MKWLPGMKSKCGRRVLAVGGDGVPMLWWAGLDRSLEPRVPDDGVNKAKSWPADAEPDPRDVATNAVLVTREIASLMKLVSDDPSLVLTAVASEVEEGGEIHGETIAELAKANALLALHDIQATDVAPQTVTDEDLLHAFDGLCHVHGKVSRGFDVEAITAPIDGPKYDGTAQWAMKYRKDCGYMLVCGKGGCGVLFSRWDGYIVNRRDFLLFIEAMTYHAKEESPAPRTRTYPR